MDPRTTDPRTEGLRVSLREADIGELVARFPKLSRTEITDIISTAGPMRTAVERELTRVSATKR